MKRSLSFVIWFITIVAISTLVSFGTLYVLNNGTKKPTFHNDTLYIKNITNGDIETVIIRTAFYRVDSTGKATGFQEVDEEGFSDEEFNIRQELMKFVKSPSNLNLSTKKTIRHYLKLGMKAVKDGL